MNLKRLFMMLILPVILGSSAMAQNKIVTGKVTDSKDGQPLPGVSVVVKGSTTGTTTAADGTFKLSVPETAKTLVISYVGFGPQEATIGGGSIAVSLVQISTALTDVVVVGYGSTRKKDLTGSITVVTSKDFNKGPISTPEQLITGKVAGVQVTSNSGAPGSGSRIRIRGGASLSASNDPLIVVDGVPLSNSGIAGAASPLSFINPNDIESFNILKDASATAIYGSRASNGVIIITTKKGKSGGKFRATFSSTASESFRTGQVDVLSSSEYRDIVAQEGGTAQQALLGSANTNWQDVIFRNAYTGDFNLSLTGGIKALPYRVSVGYLGQSGILLTSSLKRPSASINISPYLFDKHLKIDINVKGAINQSRFANEGAIGSAVSFDPTQPVYGGKYGGYFEWIDPATNKPNVLAAKNPLGLLEQVRNTSNSKRAISNVQLDYKFHFLPDLRLNVNAGYDASTGEGTVITDSTASFVVPNFGASSQYKQIIRNKLFESYLNYVKDIKSIKSRVDVMTGYGYQDFLTENPQFLSYNLRGDSIGPKGQPSKFQNTLVSFFSRLNYVYSDRYLLTLNFRADGSSRFGPDNRWGYFPSGALAWKINQESFLRNSKVVSDLKLRVGYGITGQQDGIGNYDYLPIYTLGNGTAQYQFGDQFYNTYRGNAYYANRKWEQTANSNIGLDFGLFDGFVSGTFDYFIKKTKDLLNFITLPAGSNLSNAIVANIGSLENRGYELTLNFNPIRTKNVDWNLSVNGTYITKNEITKLTLNDDPAFKGNETGGIAGGVGNNIQINSVGYNPNSFYVYKQVYDVDNKPIEGLFEDLNGDGVISGDDRYRYKKPEASAYLGLSNSLTVKNWSLLFVMRANLDNYIYNNVSSNNGAYRNFTNSAGFLSNVNSSVLETGFSNNQYFSDYYIENASFLRMDNLSLGYNFATKEAGRNIRLSAIVQNVFVVTKYSGLDPEVNGGIDNNIYPRPRVFSLAMNIDF